MPAISLSPRRHYLPLRLRYCLMGLNWLYALYYYHKCHVMMLYLLTLLCFIRRHAVVAAEISAAMICAAMIFIFARLVSTLAVYYHTAMPQLSLIITRVMPPRPRRARCRCFDYYDADCYPAITPRHDVSAISRDATALAMLITPWGHGAY